MNDEISTKDPKNNVPKLGMTETISASPAESKWNNEMNKQYTDSIANDKIWEGPHSDSTGNTPKGYSEVTSEKPIYNGDMHDGDSKPVKDKVDWKRG